MAFTVDTSKLNDFLDLAPKKTSIALLRATKKGGEVAQTAGKRLIAKDMNLKSGAAKKAIELDPPNERTLVATLSASLKRIPLIDFKGTKGPEPSRGKGRGVTYNVGDGRSLLPSGFITTTKANRRGVYKRKTKAREPIRERFGPSIGRVFDLHRKEIATVGADAAEKELDRLLNKIFGVKK